MEFVVAVLFMTSFVFVLLSIRAAYRNGVADGHGFACEPWNPAYQEAGKILASQALTRWENKMAAPQKDLQESEMLCSECRDGCSLKCDCWCHKITELDDSPLIH